MKCPKTARVTISLPDGLVAFADRLAREQDISRSEVIAALIEKEQEAHIQKSMAEGYLEMAEDDRALVEDSYPAVSEMISRNTRWDSHAND